MKSIFALLLIVTLTAPAIAYAEDMPESSMSGDTVTVTTTVTPSTSMKDAMEKLKQDRLESAKKLREETMTTKKAILQNKQDFLQKLQENRQAFQQKNAIRKDSL